MPVGKAPLKGTDLATLVDALDWLPRHYGNLDAAAEHRVPSKYYSPGFIAAFAAYLTLKGVPRESLVFENPQHEGYFSALGLGRAVWGVDDYQYQRRNAGVNYAMLTCLASQDDVEQATAQINGCLRDYASNGPANYSLSPAFKELTHVVGEMHDNVWSHGLNTGFSVAQKQKLSGKRDDHIIEFSLADCGMGFLAELKASGIARNHQIRTHREALQWCLQEGNSSKLAEAEDEWAQAVPDDFVGRAPFAAPRIAVGRNGNHHQGLGLAKLVELAKSYAGVLNIASGDCLMVMSQGREPRYRTLTRPWKGVAISLSIKESCLMAAKADEAEDVSEIMNLLRGL